MVRLTRSPPWLEINTAEERPDLWKCAQDQRLFDGLWPEYNLHGNDSGIYFGQLFPRFPRFQMLFTDRRSGRLIARARTIPFRWDGTLAGLPRGIDAMGLAAVEEPKPTALSALAAEVVPDYQGMGLSSLLVEAMRLVARQDGLAPLVAPVRPNWKHRYPLVPIDHYAAWCSDDGLPFDPWMRVHARLGAETLRPEPRSMRITAGVSEWEAWTQIRFPEPGWYTFPDCLAPLKVVQGTGLYWEPNVWMQHGV